jgi:hypothetical protein
MTNDTAIQRRFSSGRPSGDTPTRTCIYHIFIPYLKVLGEKHDDMESLKSFNMIVITYGMPPYDAKSILLAMVQKLDSLEAPPFPGWSAIPPSE